MVFWILGGILLLLGLLIFSHLRIRLTYTDTLQVHLSFWCFRFRLLPKKKKKPRIKDYSTKHLLKLKRKRRQRAGTGGKQRASKDQTGQSFPTPSELTALVKELYETFQAIPKQLIRYLKWRCAVLRLTVGSDDAATTALLVGGLTEGVRGIEAFLTEQFHYQRTGRAEFAVLPDFTRTTCQAEVEMEFRLRVWQVVSLGTKTLLAWNQWNQKKQDKNKEAIQ